MLNTSKRDKRTIYWMAVSANLFGSISVTGINVAIPEIQKEMSLSAALVGWLPLSSILAMLITTIPLSHLGDIWGRKKITLLGLWIAIMGSFLCALTKTPISFLFCRGLMGMGLAAIFTSSTAMITAVYPKNETGRVLGTTISSVYIGLSLGPVICGILTASLGWPSMFWFSGLSLLPSLFLTYGIQQEQIDSPGEKYDYLGAFLWAIATVTSFSGLTHLNHPYGLFLALTGIVFSTLFIRYSLRSDTPILDIHLFLNSKRFSFSSLAALISYMVSASTGFLISLYLQYIKDMTPKEAGLILMVQPLFQALFTPLAGRLADKKEAGHVASIGLFVLLCAITFLAFDLSPSTTLFRLIVNLALLGVGFAIFAAPNSSAMMGSVPENEIGQASSTITLTRISGQVLSISITTFIFILVIGPGTITPAHYARFLKASILCLRVFIPLCAIGIIASSARGPHRPV